MKLHVSRTWYPGSEALWSGQDRPFLPLSHVFPILLMSRIGPNVTVHLSHDEEAAEIKEGGLTAERELTPADLNAGKEL